MNENKTIPTTPIIGQIYTAVILAVYEQEQEQDAKQDTSGWHRYRLVIDIADGDSKGYYGYNYNDFDGRQYNGVLDWYLPMDDYDANRYDIIANQIAQQQAADTVIQYNHNASYTSLGVPYISDTDKSYYYNHKRTIDNINTILIYNNIDTLPADLTGLFIPIKLSMHDGVMPIIDSWLPSVSSPAPATADNAISHYTPIADIDAVIMRPARQKLTDILHSEIVKGRDIRVATPDGIAALRAKLQANNTQNLPAHTPQMPSNSSPCHNTTPPPSVAPTPSPAPSSAPDEVPTGVIVDDIVAALHQQEEKQEQKQDDEKSASDILQQALMLFDNIDDTATRQQQKQEQDEFTAMFAPPPVANRPKVRLCIVPDRPQYSGKKRKK